MASALAQVGIAASGGRVPAAKPTLTHAAATGQFTISNYDAAATYVLSVTAGTATRSGATITLSNANSICTVYMIKGKTVSPNATCERKAYTYSSVQTCNDNCGSAYYWPSGNCPGPNCCNSYNNCWGGGVDGSCAADGTICCGGSRGQTCTTNQVKNPTPSGYTDSYSEWWKAT